MPALPHALPAASAALSPEELDYLEWGVLNPSRSSAVCLACHHFLREVGRHCVTPFDLFD